MTSVVRSLKTMELPPCSRKTVALEALSHHRSLTEAMMLSRPHIGPLVNSAT